MKPGHLALVPEGELLSIDEQASIDQAAAPPYEEAFREQQQKIQLLSKYYDDVVAELRAMLDESEEGSYIRPSVASTPSADD
jgi:dihydroxyacid dehydratase/phosphogluconate dehydratase